MKKSTAPRRGASVSRPEAAIAAPVMAGPLSHASRLTACPVSYYDLLQPAGGSTKPPLLLIPGGAHSGACYLSTADGRPGWAHAFVRRGYAVAVADWPGCGRSGYVASDKLDGELVVAGLGRVLESLGQPAVVLTHSMSGAYGWKLLERYGRHIERLVGIAPSPPGNIQPAPEVLREDEDTVEAQLFKGAAVAVLSQKEAFVASRDFVDKKLIGTGTLFPRDQAANYAASLIAIPPRLLLERFNIGGSQLKVADFAHFSGKRVLVMTGTHDADHPVSVDRPIVDWLNEHGAKADFLYLGERGIEGNGHMMMLEKNSDALADLIVSWLEAP